MANASEKRLDAQQAGERAGEAGREPAEAHRRLSRDDDQEHGADRRPHGAGTTSDEPGVEQPAGLRTQGGPFDNRKQPSILDPAED